MQRTAFEGVERRANIYVSLTTEASPMEKIFFIDRLETYKIRGLYVTVRRFYYSKTYHAREVPLT